MLQEEEIKRFIEEDTASVKKQLAEKGDAYYNAEHDIKDYEIYYVDADGNVLKDDTRSNIKIAHPFFTELVDQATQYILSGDSYYIKSDLPELQTYLNEYFNENEEFIAELSELITGCQTKGFEYMYAYKNENDKTAFMCADSLGVVQIEARFASDKQEHIIYHYVDRIDSKGKMIRKIQDWTATEVYHYIQIGNESIKPDEAITPNPCAHTMYKKAGQLYYKSKSSHYIPFFRMDNNKRQISCLKVIKPLIDDYDLMNCGLSNNIQDGAEMYWIVKGFGGDGLTELINNIKAKKHVGIDTDGDVDIRTVNIPYEARKIKLEEDEKNIYRFGFGLNTSGLKDTAATTSVAIKAAYSLLDLKCSKLLINLKKLLRKLIDVVLMEINEINNTDYRQKDVYFDFNPEIISNAQENAQIALTQSQEQQTRITTLLNISTQLDNETLMQLICEQLDIDYEEIKDKLPAPEEAEQNIIDTQKVLDDGIEITEAEKIKEEAQEEISKALNGAQTQSLLAVFAQYKSGQLNSEEATSVLSVALGISEEKARNILRIKAS